MAAAAAAADRLSALPEKALVSVLSQLRSDEAARTSGLSRRWRRVHEAVPVIDLADTKCGDRYGGASDNKLCFDLQVTSAIFSKAAYTPLRAFRLSAFHPPYDLLDQWVVTAVTSGAEELDLTLRYWDSAMRRLCPFSGSEESPSTDFCRDDQKRFTATQRHIFRCRSLRRLGLANWSLDLPSMPMPMPMPALDTLCLSRIMDPAKLLPRLLASCPSLASLTLEQCPTIVDLEVPCLSLRNFSMLCCHNAKAVALRTARLESLRFKGGLATVFQIANHRGIRALTIDICEELSSKSPKEIAPVTTLIGRCSNLDYLHLSLRPSIAYYSSLFTGVLRELRWLRRLSLEGCLLTAHGVKSVAALLANTHNLEELSLFPLAPPPPKNEQLYDGYDTVYGGSDSDTEEEDGGGIGIGTGAVNDGGTRMPDCLWRMNVGCLNRKVRRIGLWNYQGQALDKMLARFLLSRAAVLEEFSVRLADERDPRKDEIAKELGSWPWNSHTTVTCK
ncbi:F-box/FBD/LRR-repeat protein At2g26030-like [Brachypodium distachyon]|uniref:F-box/FBD/LRR-repeat protein At2g26030-like n=1 Tax=Brachypodium distachyon TaxID=15368 RepID=UPI000D0D5FC9|nr:F-box/FBD/LRR-repeat protein At2g26030-like [Brachypodium distachyon]|eukprot:XP_024311865.1 F-box/FBD/LRR-repeat protein At2g26030-like [Brachypodium distachyon]